MDGINHTRQMPDEAHKAGIALDYGLYHHSPSAWRSVADTFRRVLAADVRMGLALAALAACDDDDLDCIFVNVGKGQPVPVFDNVMGEATSWAAFSNPEELEAYAVAAFSRMRLPRKQAFLRSAKRRAK